LTRQPALRGSEVLPLYSRLSQADQDRVFAPHHGRRVVLATNVAETSLTVPGIRCVIDAGTARIKRYSLRSKVEQLLVEPISQAAANQRSGPLRPGGQWHVHPPVRRQRLCRPPALHRPGNPARLWRA
jgi:ATP-dependent helicase HrpA